MTVYMLFPDEMRSDLPLCCGFRLTYIISDRKTDCFGNSTIRGLLRHLAYFEGLLRRDLSHPS